MYLSTTEYGQHTHATNSSNLSRRPDRKSEDQHRHR